MAKSMRSVMKHNFSEVPHAEIPRSSFDRSFGHKTTFDAGILIPFFVDEALPGDTFNLKTAGFARLATPIFPVMDNMYMETFYFAVPNRLLWDNWQKMMGEQDNPGDSTDFIVPVVDVGPGLGMGENSIADHMGIPTHVPNIQFSALFTRAYALIYNEWFRDENLQDKVPFSTGDGPDDAAATATFPFRRGKRHDYFTSCLPFPQKGPAVELPLGNTAPVVGTGDEVPSFRDIGAGYTSALNFKSSATDSDAVFWDSDPLLDGGAHWADPKLEADLSNATAATINQLRQAFQVQKMFERDARGGTRYTEMIKAHFGVTSPDMRLQRPEYLGGGTTPITVNPLFATADTFDAQGPDNGKVLGTLSGVGTGQFQSHGFTKSFTEHCIIIGLVNVRADITYQQGLNRMFSRSDRLDFFLPVLAHLGEQEVLNQEIFTQGTGAGTIDEEIFGYQERYAEYRYRPSQISGIFRSNSESEPGESNTLDAWHLSQDFEDLPTLSAAFIVDDPPIDRVIAIPSEPHFIADFYHKLICARPMPLFGVPGNIDRF